MSWKAAARRDPLNFYRYRADGGEVRIFMTEPLFEEMEESLGPQIQAARRFPGVLDVAITPDAHTGYGVPVGCVLATRGTLAMGPVGYDIGCGMAALRSEVSRAEATPDKVRAFSQKVMARVGLGAGSKGEAVSKERFQEVVRGGATALGVQRGNAERDRIPVDDDWDIPRDSRAWRGQNQLGSLGGGNHFIELQHDGERLWVMFHTGSRGFGHGLASYYFEKAQQELGLARGQMDLGYFEPSSRSWRSYKNAVAAGGNFAIVNRLMIGRQVSQAFAETFGREARLVYEISHNLAQEEHHPDLFDFPVWIHRKGATRALPAGHPMLAGTPWAEAGHPVLIPGSMGDSSYVLRPLPGAARSLYSVNHGCGRRKSRSAARRDISQAQADRQMKDLGVLVNAGGRVPVDESPDCYKPAEEVIRAVTDAGLARVEVRLTPIASIKGSD
ncbi:MAG TPA: RtcB family protein [Vicinamibacteria bacterium]|nr:RtcB family protein [Vicinamibacteria bacterium]